MNLACRAALAAAALAISMAPAYADPFTTTLPVSISGPNSLVEPSFNIKYTISVRNNTGQPLILDMALALITPLGPDPDDTIFFSGPGGANGLDSFPATLAIGATGKFVYSVDASNPPGGTDFGVNNFEFWVEYSKLMGVANVPTTNLSGPALLLIQGQASAVVDPAALTTLENCFLMPTTCNGPTAFLYPPSLNGGNPAYGGFGEKFVTVRDIPEPSALLLLGGAVLGLAGYRRLRRDG